jgi:hypothetical protein
VYPRRRLSKSRPLSYIQRRGVRSFQRVFGERYPPYLGLAFLFGFFALLGFFAIRIESMGPGALFVSATIGLGTGLLPYFADDSLLPIPNDASADEVMAARRRTKLANLLMILGGIAVPGSYIVLGAIGFYATATFLFVGLAIYSLAIFGTTMAIPCPTCGAVTLFRRYSNQPVCTRCGTRLQL